MTSVFNIAISGLNNAAARVANSASNIVNALSINHEPRDVISISNSVGNNNLGVSTQLTPRLQSGTPVSPDNNSQAFVGNNSVDIATELVNIIVAKNLYAADAFVIKTADKMQKALLDIET